MKKNCSSCEHGHRLRNAFCKDCLTGNPPSNWKPDDCYEPDTRAEWIREMTDEELAKFILDCDNNDIGFCHVGMCEDDETCLECALKWLRQPIEE